ncbi:tetratricopeptide repeat protein [Acaryochloris marina]|uniref:TPR domain protein, putative n=1 Tax=Acaryochloris marina (strain MBIC 11017) TaxID=329726 RepID=B0C443_ACAM1|nr:tetratricopeptide repeat protein [Acaryochloris marina]ABW27434.1 TPR domain protein, putative [Acaryochloris marina MBIC11017]BDM82173.1 hypothetical protein AM10699_50370 [Acaryochloris marina MBIC10699]
MNDKERCLNSQSNDLLLSYQESIEIIENEDKKLSASEIINTFKIRDIIQTIINSKKDDYYEISPILLKLDARLEKQSDKITQAINIEKLCRSFHPNKDFWWWHLKPTIPVHWYDKYDRLFNIFSIIILAASLCILFDISSRVISPDPDLLSSLFLAVQGALTTLFAAVIITHEGQELVTRIFSFMKISPHFRQEVQLGAAVFCLILLIIFRTFLPNISNHFYNKGLNFTDTGSISSAMASYHRALSIDPENDLARFNIAVIYEKLSEYKKAEENFKIASLKLKIEASDESPLKPIEKLQLEAINRLSRLYIIRENYSEAVKRLDKIKAIIDQKAGEKIDPELGYATIKNLGWARYEQSRYNEAIPLLEQAIGFPIKDEKKASAFCLLAQSLKKAKHADYAVYQNYEKCIQYADSEIPEEDEWIPQARNFISNSYQELKSQ